MCSYVFQKEIVLTLFFLGLYDVHPALWRVINQIMIGCSTLGIAFNAF